jgi:uncharacterized membrane protein
MDIIKTLAEEFKLKVEQVEKTVELIDGGDTIPFIARYRKEVTGSLDDAILRDLNDRLEYLRNIEKRKEEVKNLIEAQGNLTPEIEQAILNAKTITEVDDIYRPFRPKRKTRASVAKEKGLEPLALIILEQRMEYQPTIEEIAAQVLSEVSLPRLIKNKLKPRRRLSGWEITLLILGFPLWFPLLIAAFAVLLSVYVAIWAVMISLYATDLALGCSALACVAACVAMLATGQGPLALTSLGAACILAGLTIFMLLGCNVAAKGLIALSRLFGRGVKRVLIGKGGNV